MSVTITGNYFLQSNDFHKSFHSSVVKLKNAGDFCDVTLVSDDAKPFQAHKLVLSASSEFFREIFRIGSNSNPLFYIRGLSERSLQSILQFLYFGEVQIDEKELGKFLDAAKDLKLTGLYEEDTQTTDSETNFEKHSNVEESPETENIKAIDYESETICANPEPDCHGLDVTENSTTFLHAKEEKLIVESQSIDSKVNEMVFKLGGSWICKVCNYSKERKSNVTSHAETNHMEVNIECNICSHTFKNRPTYMRHVRSKHTKVEVI